MIRLIRILTISYGWLTMEFGRHLMCCSDFIDYDTPRILLEGVADILDDPSREVYILWPNEPKASIMRVSSEEGKVTVSLFDSKKETIDISPGQELKELCAQLSWAVTRNIEEIVNDLTVDFSLYEGGSGRELYEEHWMPFPDVEFRRLKTCAFRMKEQNVKLDMLITTYMTEE